MADDLAIRDGIVIPAAELKWQFSRSSGPGGQSVNKTDTRVSLTYDLAKSRAFPVGIRERAIANLAPRLVHGALTVHSDTHRSQLQNRIAAMERLARLLRDATAPPTRARRKTKPTRSAQQRRIDGKKQRGETKRLRRNIDDS